MITPEEAIDRLNVIYGRHDGCRAVHAKGDLWEGTFKGTPEGASLTRALHLQGQPVEATVRLSNASGDPGDPDHALDDRGLAVKLHLPDGSRTDIVATSVPRFVVASVEEVLEVARAGRPGPGRMWRLLWYLARHPRALAATPVNLAGVRPPRSYAAHAYYAVHAFRWVDAEGSERYVRYTWVPEVSERPLSPWEARRRDPDYLRQELRDRLNRAPVRFTLRVQIAADGDDVDDPRSVWPRSRPCVDAGVLEITGPASRQETAANVVVFDPTRVTDGIELSADPMLHFRAEAYAVSAARRTGTHPAPDGQGP